MASITEAKPYLQIGIGMGVDLVLEQLELAVEKGEITDGLSVMEWIMDSRARLEEHHGA